MFRRVVLRPMIQITDPLQITGVLALLVFIAYLLFRTFGVKYLNSKIDSKFATELETHKNTLLKEAKYKEIQYGELRKQQADVIKIYYSFLSKLYRSAEASVQSGLKDERLHTLIEEFEGGLCEFKNHYFANKIFFTESICSQTEILMQALKQEIEVRKSAERTWNNIQDRLKENPIFYSYPDKIQPQTKALMGEVENLFRELMGVV